MDLLNFIAEKGFAPGDKLPREKDLEAQFNMSAISLRRALGDLAEQGVIEKIQGLGTFLRKPVSDMDKQGTIVLLEIQERMPYSIPSLARELQVLLEERRLDLRFIPANRPGRHLDRMIGDAAGVFVTGQISHEWAQYMESISMPLVVLGSNPFPDRFHTVTFDWALSVELLVNHFAGQGMKRIGLVNGEIDYFPAQRMYEGYRRALENNGIAFDERRVIWPIHQEIYQGIDKLLGSVDLDAVVVEAGAIPPLMNWHWNHPTKQSPVLGVAEWNTNFTRNLVANDSHRIVNIRYENELLSAALSALLHVQSGANQRIHVALKPRVANI